MSDFDLAVLTIRRGGIAAKHKPFGKKKADCTPAEWAAHREYMAARYRDPRCRAMHRRNQIAHLAKRAMP